MTFDPLHKWLGIPPAEQPPHYYRLLGLTKFEADPDVIEHAADQRMAHLRPFQAGEHSDDATRLLNEIATARRVLLSDVECRRYDHGLKLPEMAVAPPPTDRLDVIVAEVVPEPLPHTRPPTIPVPPPPSNGYHQRPQPLPAAPEAMTTNAIAGWILAAATVGLVILMEIAGS